MTVLTISLVPDLFRGALDFESTDAGILPHRLPASARRRNEDPAFAMAESQPSGVRLVFRTSARMVELETLPTKRAYIGMPPRPDGVYDLVIDGELMQQASATGGKVMRIGMAPPSLVIEPGSPQVLRFADLPARDKRVEIWLPHDEVTELLALRADAPVWPDPSGQKTWLHYGSSISQGSNATSPTGIWPVVAARRADVDLLNLGFGGNALLDPFVARAMRDTPADFISVKIGINLVNADLMRMRAFGPALDGFLDTIRDGHPHTPLLVVSPLFCPVHETVPGPTQFDLVALASGQLQFQAEGKAEDVARGKLTLVGLRQAMEKLVARRAEEDANIHYLDGLALYGAADNAVLPLPDGLHPDMATHALVGERFARAVFQGGGLPLR